MVLNKTVVSHTRSIVAEGCSRGKDAEAVNTTEHIMNTALTSNAIVSNSNVDTDSERTEVEIKVRVVLVNGVPDMPASIENFHERFARWIVETEKTTAEAMNEKRIAELTNPQKIAEASVKVLSLFGDRYTPRDLFMSQVMSALTTSDGATPMHLDLYQPVRTAVEAWLKAEKESGRIIISKGKSGGVKAVPPDLAQAAE